MYNGFMIFIVMETNYNLIPFIDALGLVQGITLGLILILINTKRKSTIWLGFFIIVYALDLFPRIFEDLNIILQYPKYPILPIDLSWFLFPLFYIYVQKVSILEKQKISYWTLIPGVLFFLFQLVFYFKSIEVQIGFRNSFWAILAVVGNVLYSIFIGFLILKWIRHHKTEIQKQYASIEYKELSWSWNFVIIGLLFTVAANLISFFETGFYFQIIATLINVALLYWVSIRGILQQNIEKLSYTGFDKKENLKTQEVISNQDLTKSKANYAEFIKQLNSRVVEDNLFSQTDLTIIDVAKKLKVHPKRISTAINSQLGLNFNTYINQFRIEKAKEFILSDLSQNYSIEGIGNEVGFQSKSAFYKAFRTNTGTTPSKFKTFNSTSNK